MLAGSLAVVVLPLLRLLYGPAFVDAAVPVWLLLPGVVALGAGGVLASHIAGLGRPGLNLISSSVGLIVTLGLDLLLIPLAGMAGAALASTAAYASVAGLTAWFFSRSTGVPIADVVVVERSDLTRLASRIRATIAGS